MDTGDRIRLTGEGQAGARGGPSGDLYVEMHVQPHQIFQRDGRDLHCEIPISFTDAAIGGELEVPTLDGRVKLKIPAETQTGKLFRLRSKGVTSIRGGSPGDLLCRVVLETPVNLTNRQREILEEFQEIYESQGKKQSPKRSSWFAGVKKICGWSARIVARLFSQHLHFYLVMLFVFKSRPELSYYLRGS